MGVNVFPMFFQCVSCTLRICKYPNVHKTHWKNIGDTLKPIECVFKAHWRHIITHWNTLQSGTFLCSCATITTMCFNVFQCAKNTLKKHWRHIEAHLKSMCFEHIAKSASNTLRNSLSLVHIAEHIEKSQCAPMCWAAQCARNTLKHIMTHWNTLAYYLIWRGVQIKWLAQDARNFSSACGMPPVPNWWSRWKVHLKVLQIINHRL